MKHAGEATLDRLQGLLKNIRQYAPPLKEKKRGTFYLKSAAFLHFHEDLSGIFADLKVDGDWTRYSTNNPEEWQSLLDAIAQQLAHLPCKN